MATHGWVYGAWRSQSTLTARRDMLGLHLQELDEANKPTSGSGAGMSASYSDIESKLARLEPKFDELDKKVRDLGGPMMVLNLRRRSST